MKKIVSILLTVAMLLMSMSAFCVMAEEASTDTSTDTTTEATTDERLIVDIDFADYDGTSVKDTKGTLSSPWTGGVLPSVGTHTAPDGETTLKYAQWDPANASMFMQFGGSQNVNAVLSNQELSVEMWVKLPDISDASQANKWPEFFNVTNGTGTKLWTIESAYDSGSNGYMILNATGSGAGSTRVNNAADILADKWAHVVTTRSYEPYTATAANGQLYFKLYINGVLMGATAREVKEANLVSGGSIDLGTLYWATESGSVHKYFGGAFGQVRIYNDELTSSDIVDKYSERNSIYQTEEQINYAQTTKFFNNYGTLRTDDWSGYNGSNMGDYWTTSFDVGTHTSETGTTVNYVQWDKSKEQYTQMGMKQGADAILANDSLTAEMWVKFPNIKDSSESGVWPIFFSVCTGTGTPIWSLGTAYDSGYKGYILLQGISASSLVKKVENLLGGKWAHIVTSRTYIPASSTAVHKLYINGELMATVTEDAFARGTNINIGPNYWMRQTANKKWGGGFGAFNVYKGELSEDMIEKKYNEKKSIYQTMDDTAVYEADVANNNVNNSLSGYMASSSWITALQQDTYDNGAGISTNYFTFDGTNRFWSYGASEAQMTTKRYIVNNDETSVEMWLKSDTFYNVNYTPFAMIKSGPNIKKGGAWYLEMGNGGIAQYTGETMLNNAVVSMEEKENVWFHVVMTRDFDRTEKTITYKTYVDGVLKDTYVLENQTSVGDGDDSTNSVYFGNTWDERNVATAQFNGGIAKAKVYKSILTDAKVASIYNAEKDAFKDAGKLGVTEVVFEGAEEGVVINQLKGNDTVWCQVTLENSSKQEEKHYAAYGAIYDIDGKLVNIVELNQDNNYGTVSKGTDASGNGKATAMYTWENLSLEEGSTMKVFIWSTDEMMAPVSSEVYELPWVCA